MSFGIHSPVPLLVTSVAITAVATRIGNGKVRLPWHVLQNHAESSKGSYSTKGIESGTRCSPTVVQSFHSEGPPTINHIGPIMTGCCIGKRWLPSSFQMSNPEEVPVLWS